PLAPHLQLDARVGARSATDGQTQAGAIQPERGRERLADGAITVPPMKRIEHLAVGAPERPLSPRRTRGGPEVLQRPAVERSFEVEDHPRAGHHSGPAQYPARSYLPAHRRRDVVRVRGELVDQLEASVEQLDAGLPTGGD